MGRKKQQRFADNAARRNVIEPGKALFESIRGEWSTFFDNDNPIVIELGCGRGEYTVGLAEIDRGKNFIGIDIKGSRIWVGSTYAIENRLDNVAFLRTMIQHLEKFFAEQEVSEVWITFPDPRPKDRDEKRRLTFPRFMEMYRKILKPNGWVKFKTDNTELFDYTLSLIEEQRIKVKNLVYTHDLYHSDLLAEHQGVQTKYEKLFSEKGETIKYMRFQFE